MRPRALSAVSETLGPGQAFGMKVLAHLCPKMIIIENAMGLQQPQLCQEPRSLRFKRH